MEGLRGGILSVDEGILESESLGEHAAVLRMGVVVLGGNACLGVAMMMAEEGSPHVVVTEAAVGAYSRVHISKDLFCIVKCR